MKAATQAEQLKKAELAISIHAAREGGDDLGMRKCNDYPISIHAAREGGDHRGRDRTNVHFYFNPRRP